MLRPPDAHTLERLRREVEQRMDVFQADLEHIVNIESGSYTKAGVDRVADWMSARLAALGASVERHHHDDLGDDVVATFEGRAGGRTVLLIGHADTVFDPGYIARRPYEVQADRILGPGTSDMKSGLLAGLYALEALRATGRDGAWLPVGRLHYVVNGDEEIGSPRSTPLIAALARSADAGLVLESARASGDIVSRRKGMLHLRATVHGRSAHAGVEPEKGRSATLEAAYKTVALHALNSRWPGVTVNVGELRGGTRPNIVADECVLTVDLRARTGREQDEAEAAILALLEASTVPDTSTDIVRLARTRPMERTAASAELVEAAVAIAAGLGFGLGDAETGGSSDANTVAAANIPVIDGLGPVGGDDHTPLEYVLRESIAPRTTLLAALLLTLGE
jgi:glutamate carboxypeptidase